MFLNNKVSLVLLHATTYKAYETVFFIGTWVVMVVGLLKTQYLLVIKKKLIVTFK